MKARFTLLSYLVMLTLLVGCITPAPLPPAQAESSPAATSDNSTMVTSEAAPGSMVAAGECGEGFRLFDHEFLQSEALCIPAHPQRVLALDIASLELLLLTRQTPVGTAEWILEELPILLPQFADVLEGMEGVGYPADLEQVALMDPDLILATDDTIDVAQATLIAPVIVADQSIYEDWKIGMQFFSAVLNVPDLYAEMEANYWARVGELQGALGDTLDDEISIVSASTYDVWLWMPDSSPGKIVADVGLARPPSQALVADAAIAEYGARQYVPVSEERLDLVDGDAVFYFTYAALDPEVAKIESDFIKAFEQKPLWLSLNAVQAGRAYFVGGHWWRAQTYLLANLVIDDLFTHLTDVKATKPVLDIQQ